MPGLESLSAKMRIMDKALLDNNALGLFVQDSWRITPRLNATNGLRYVCDATELVEKSEHILGPRGVSSSLVRSYRFNPGWSRTNQFGARDGLSLPEMAERSGWWNSRRGITAAGCKSPACAR